MARDSQRKRVYDAEDSADTLYWTPDISNIKDVRAWVKSIVKSRWFQARWNITRVKVMDGRGRKRATGYAYPSEVYVTNEGVERKKWRGVLKLPVWSRYEMTILHELAHVVTDYEYAEDDTVAPHGREFCSNYLKLVKRWMGKEAHATLKNAFEEKRVKYKKRSRHEKS